MAVRLAGNYFYDSDDIVHLFTVAGRNAVVRPPPALPISRSPRGDANAPINSPLFARPWMALFRYGAPLPTLASFSRMFLDVSPLFLLP